jgi:hypothetical protein
MLAPRPSVHVRSLSNRSKATPTVVAVTAPATPETADLNPAAGGTISIARRAGRD